MHTEIDHIYTSIAPKVMPPILLCWPTNSEAHFDDMLETVHLFAMNPSFFFKDKSCKMQFDMIVHTKQKYVIEFFHAKNLNLLTFSDTEHL